MENPKYIVIEGLDSCGKSTLINKLKQEYPEFVYVKEPGDQTFETTQTIRELLLHKESISTLTEAYLFAADRSCLLPFIKEQLALGKTVISDRNVCSSLAYQSQKDLTFAQVLRINRDVIFQCVPNHICIIDMEIEDYEKRMARKHKDRIEQRDLHYFKCVHSVYQNMVHLLNVHSYSNFAERITYIQTQATAEQTYQLFKEKINLKEGIKNHV